MNVSRIAMTGLLVLGLVAVAAPARGDEANDPSTCRLDCSRCDQMSVDFKDVKVPVVLEFLAIAARYRLEIHACLQDQMIDELKLTNVRHGDVLDRLKKETGMVCRVSGDGLLFGCDESQLDGMIPRPPKDPRRQHP
jgi:hypothetical protein